MKNKQLEFYNFMARKCEYKERVFSQGDISCNKNKKDIKICNYNNCFYVKNENKGLLNPAMELLRILEIKYLHIPKTKTGKHDILKTNKGMPDLFIFLDNNLIAVEFKTVGSKLSKEQINTSEQFQNTTYLFYEIINDIGHFYREIISSLSDREMAVMDKNILYLQKWLLANNVEL